MRTEKEMFDLIIKFAKNNNYIRLAMLEGSRTNINIPKDNFQDYDITYFVTDIEYFIKDDTWLKFFGNIIMLQKPEDMELFPPEQAGYSYLILFDDYNKIDLTLLPINELENYLTQDKLIKPLLDKDNLIKNEIVPTDIDYHIKKPTAREFDDCCNEFWNVTTYVVKGLCRREILFAVDHINQILRYELLRMISWKIGIETNFSLSIGKNFKFMDRYVNNLLWNKILSTYSLNSYENVWKSLFTCHELFREISKEISEKLNFTYPEYDKNITKYTSDMLNTYFKNLVL